MTDSEGANETIADILVDFGEFLNEALVAHAFAVLGVVELRRVHREKVPEHQRGWDPVILVNARSGDSSPPDHDACVSLSQALELMRDGGPIEARLSQQWIVSTFAAWEEWIRPRMAKVHGCDERGLMFPLFGDLRHLRNDVVHHGGIATGKNAGKCKFFGNWLSAGDEILLTADALGSFLRLVPWSEMEAGPTSAATDVEGSQVSDLVRSLRHHHTASDEEQ
jgi:hypothetical protein